MRQMLSLAAATALFSAPAFADDDKPKRLSIDISAGVRPDMAQLGATITQDGTVDTADSTVANLLYSTDKAFMSDRNNMTIWDASQATDSTFKLMGAKPGVGGAMLGMELGARARYELDDVIDFPLYVQAGFHYTSKISGGEQSRTLGDVSQNNDTVSALFTLNGLDPADYDGGVMKNEYDASWVEIPFTLGVKAGFPKKPYTHAYGGLGLSNFSGGFSVAMDVDQNYSPALATHVVDSTSVGDPQLAGPGGQVPHPGHPRHGEQAPVLLRSHRRNDREHRYQQELLHGDLGSRRAGPPGNPSLNREVRQGIPSSGVAALA